MSRTDELNKANRRTMRKLMLVAVAMFGFGYALVPLYDVFCDLTGINGKTKRGTIEAAQIDRSRTVTVEFLSHVDTALAWEFRPMQTTMTVHPGEVVVARYHARNLAASDVTGRAVPSVSPSRAAGHFRKVECFCFSEQKLAAGETKEMPVQFYVDTKLPKEVDRVTLSYAFFNISKDAKQGGDRPVAAVKINNVTAQNAPGV
jgi:cytochrome c oxidase assembly protein subunit 11